LSVLEKTILGRSFIIGASGSFEVGQYCAIIRNYRMTSLKRGP
jgi:hypothetical protein